MRITRRLTAALRAGVLVLCIGSLPFHCAAAVRPPSQSKAEGARHFDAHIAPLLARHCLECHDGTAKKGKLDLSRKEAALAGGKNGRVIMPGKAAESLLWQSVESDEMPEDRPPLSPQEKSLLRDWINSGAVWSGNEIDPLAYARDGRAAGNWLRRLTVPEYIETVRSAVGVDVEKDARRILPPDLRADGFHNTAYNLNVDLGHVEAHARLARIIVGKMDAATFASDFVKSAALTEGNLRELISSMGLRLLRGPLDDREIAAFLKVPMTVAKEGGDFAESMSYLIEAMLQSPRFIYRVEKQRGDGRPQPVGGYELASRLSYILWGGPPDKELMRAAAAGELARRRQVQAQVRRMLDDPRAMSQSARFLHEWLNLDRLENMRPHADHYPRWDQALASDMRAETLAFFAEVAWKQKRPLANLLNAQVTFATPRLAAHYGLAPNLGSGRSKDSLIALYTFGEGGGDTVRDRAGSGEPLDLRIDDASAIEWSQGRLTVKKTPALITTPEPPKRLIDAVRRSKAITIEAWITPANITQKGPARIITLSADGSQRNVTLGQDGDRFEVRFRTTKTDTNGTPALSLPRGSVKRQLMQVVFTRDTTGKAKLHVNGEEMGARSVGGDLSNWDDGYRLVLGNESTKDRPWQGTFHQVAIYSRALSPAEIRSRGEAISRYDLSAVPARGGLLTQGSVLTVGGDDASMVTRGLFVLRDLLYSTVGNAPPGVDTTPVPTKPGQSQRVIAEARLANKSCTACHSKFEPLAFGLEKFDGVGAHHEKDRHGNPLREDGQILFPGQPKPVAFKTSAEFMNLLAGSARVQKNLTRKVTQFALGRPLVESDAPILDKIHAAAQKGGGTYASLITAIVLSDLVQKTQTEFESGH